MVVSGSTRGHAGCRGHRAIDPRAPSCRGMFVEAVLQDAIRPSVIECVSEGEGTLGGGFEAGVGVGLGQAQDSEAGAVPLLGMAPGVEDRR